MCCPISNIEFLARNYNVLWQHPKSDGVWDTFLIGELHDTPGIQALNGEFFKRFALKGSSLLIEGDSEELSCKSEMYLKTYLNLSDFEIEDVSIIGWDLHHYAHAHLVIISELIQQLERVKSLVDRGENGITYCLDEFFRVDPERLAGLDRFVQYCYLKVMKILNKFLIEELLPLEKMERKGAILLKISEEIELLFYKKKKGILESFPARTNSMVEALKKVQSTCIDKPKFLIAGIKHLQEEHERLYFSKFYSLKPLYEYLNLYGRNVLVLAPKLINSTVDSMFLYDNFFAMRIQKTYRDYLAKKIAVACEIESRAAKLIQTTYRSYRSKKPKEEEIYIPSDKCAIYHAAPQIENLHQLFKEHIQFLVAKGINVSNYKILFDITRFDLEEFMIQIKSLIISWQDAKALPYYRVGRKDHEILTKVLLDADYIQIQLIVNKVVESVFNLMNLSLASTEILADTYPKICYVRTLSFSISGLNYYSDVYKIYTTLFPGANALNSSFLTALTRSTVQLMKENNIFSSLNLLETPLRTGDTIIGFF